MKQLVTDTNILSNQLDTFLNVPYTLARLNAKDVSKYLKKSIKGKGLNPEDFNIDKAGNSLADEPPTEIYEYQPFFLLKDGDEYTLLDGFRRLIWYNTPDHDIYVRIYDRKDLSDQHIMKLLIYLNHFKFFGHMGKYFDRGFALALRIIFGLDIPKYKTIFNAYLVHSNTKRSYGGHGVSDEESNQNVKERMLNPSFVKDMQFIEGLRDSGVMLNVEMGSLIYEYRTNYPDKDFDASFFLKEIKDNKIIKDLHDKYKTKGHNNGAEAQKIVNQLIPLYKNIFNSMFGAEVVKTYSEQFDEVKTLVNQLKKDKNYTKLTGSSNAYLIERVMVRRLIDKKPINFKCVIYPDKHVLDGYDFSFGARNKDKDRFELKPGLLPYDVKFVKQIKAVFKNEEIYGFKVETGAEFTFHHNYGGYNSYGKKYTTVEQYGATPCNRYDCDLFVDVTKEEIEEADKNRFKQNS